MTDYPAAPPPPPPPPGSVGQYGPLPQNSGKATAALVLGIVGVVACGFFAGIPAIIIGKQAQREIDASGGRLTGRGMATAGIVMGWIEVALGILGLIAIVGLIAAGGTVHVNS